MLVNIIIDVILVAIVIVGGFLGFKKGFILTITKPVKWLCALLLAFLLCEVVSEHIVVPLVEEPITNQITEYLLEKCGEMTKETVSEDLPTLLKLAAGVIGIDVNAFEGNDSAALIGEIVDKLALPAINLFSVIISFVVLYIIFKLCLGIVIKIVDVLIFERGLIGGINKALGAGFGAAFAFFITWIVVMIFGYIISIPAIADAEWVKEFSGGFIYKFFDSITPLDLLLSF